MSRHIPHLPLHPHDWPHLSRLARALDWLAWPVALLTLWLLGMGLGALFRGNLP